MNTNTYLEIESPYPNEVESFNNTELFPDLEFVVPGMEETLWLHKKILAKASTNIMKILKNTPGKRLEWMFEVRSEIDKQAMMKALRFCYGESLSVERTNGECCALIAAFSRLQVSCLDEVIAKLSNCALEQARSDLSSGVELLKVSTGYVECCDKNTCGLDKELAKIVFTKVKMLEHFREVVIDCLMVLPQKYLDEAEFGEPHAQCSEFYLKTMYARYHHELSREEKQKLLGNCDWSKLSCQELRELRLLDLVDKDELLVAYEKALECCENEKEKEKKKVNEVERERDRLKELETMATRERDHFMEKATRAERMIEDIMETNRSQKIHAIE